MKHATMPKVVETLLKGRARVAKGWCQGQPVAFRPDNLGGPMYCALGAIDRDFDAEWALICALPDTAHGNPMAYNDAKGRTQADILALFDRAIEGALR